MPTGSSPALHRFAILVAVLALVLNVAGSLVSSMQAAGSIPDWPKSWGHWFLQDWVGNTVYEYSHRVAAALTGIAMLVLALWMARREPLPALRAVAWIAVVVVVIQILLGGVIVLMLSPAVIGIIHVFLSQVFFALTFYLAVATSPSWIARQDRPDPKELGPRELKWAKVLMWLMMLQVLLGGASRHPTSEGLFIVALLAHLANAFVLIVVVHLAALGVVKRARGTWLAKAGFAMLGLLLLQVLVGFGVFAVAPEPLDEPLAPPEGFPQMHAIHVAASSLMLAIAVTLSVAVKKLVGSR